MKHDGKALERVVVAQQALLHNLFLAITVLGAGQDLACVTRARNGLVELDRLVSDYLEANAADLLAVLGMR